MDQFTVGVCQLQKHSSRLPNVQLQRMFMSHRAGVNDIQSNEHFVEERLATCHDASQGILFALQLHNLRHRMNAPAMSKPFKIHRSSSWPPAIKPSLLSSCIYCDHSYRKTTQMLASQKQMCEDALFVHGGSTTLAELRLLGLGLSDTLGEDGSVLVLEM